MAHTAAKHNDAAETSSVDDMRKVGGVMMLAGAITTILVLMAVTYVPKFWNIDPFGPDLDGAAGHAVTEHGPPAGGAH